MAQAGNGTDFVSPSDVGAKNVTCRLDAINFCLKGVCFMSVLTRVSPFESVQREFDSALGRLFTGRGDHDGGYLAPYGVDVREDVDHIYVEAELPGFAKEDVNVTLEN